MYIHDTQIVDTFAEAFAMWGARVVITAETAAWAQAAAQSMTGFATSIIGCKCEAGIEADVPETETPDGRPGVSVLLFAMNAEGVGKRLVERVGQCVMTCPSTACYNGLPAEETVPVGGQLRYFGDKYQISKLLGGRRLWRVPVMDGEFLVDDRFGIQPAVGGGNILILGRDQTATLRATEAAVAAMRGTPGAILPFPGGVVRSGSKPSARYSFLHASTNDAYCPTLRAVTGATQVAAAAGCVLEIVIDGLDLTLHTDPAVPLEADVLTPGRLAGLSAIETARLPVLYGNQAAELGEFFRITGAAGGELHLTGNLSRVKQIGAGMAEGRVVVHGSAGMHLGAGMSGGEIVVEGDAGDWVGPEMTGGRIAIKGNAAHMVGAAYRGSPTGLRGGEIIIFGSAGNEVGAGMRRGLIAIGGDSGDFTGVNLLAGTIVVFGHLGWRTGASMRRGTIVSMHSAELLPTFSYACTYRPVFLRLYLTHLQRLGLPVTAAHTRGSYQRWCGDAIELNRGEVLLLEPGETAATR